MSSEPIPSHSSAGNLGRSGASVFDAVHPSWKTKAAASAIVIPARDISIIWFIAKSVIFLLILCLAMYLLQLIALIVLLDVKALKVYRVLTSVATQFVVLVGAHPRYTKRLRIQPPY